MMTCTFLTIPSYRKRELHDQVTTYLFSADSRRPLSALIDAEESRGLGEAKIQPTSYFDVLDAA